MIYAVDQHNRAAYRSQIDEMFRLFGSQFPFESQTGQHGPFDKDSVYLQEIDTGGCLTAALVIDFSPVPIGPLPSLSGTDATDANEYDSLCMLGPSISKGPDAASHAELLVASFEYALAVGLTEVDISNNTDLLQTARRLQWHVLALHTGPHQCPHLSLLVDVSYDAADGIRNLHDVCGPVLAYAAAPPPYAANENRRLRIASSRTLNGDNFVAVER